MYNQSYEEYMRSVLGYSVQPEETYCKTEAPYNIHTDNLYQNNEMEKMYPEVYKVIYPKVCDICQRNLGNEITEDSLEDMSNEVYNLLEVEGNINFYINVENRSTYQSNRSTLNSVNNSRNNINMKKTEDRQRNNALLDIIRILILREFLNRNRPPIRPPHQGPRPPMPPTRPPFPGSGPRPF